MKTAYLAEKIRTGLLLGTITIFMCVPVLAEDDTPDLKAVYEKYCDSSWATLSGDGSSLSVDTNPFNFDKYTDRDALKAIPEINKALGLPDSVYDRMGSTTAMQGVQSFDFDNLHISWSYHPDNGMEVIYELASESDQELTTDDIKEVYEKQCESSWATLSGDGTSLSVDTNPFNLDKYTDRDALKAIPEINKALGLPDSVYDRMGSTTAMQGVQSVDYGNLHVSWSYHPDNGMEVIYELAVESDQELTADDLKEVYKKQCESSWATLSGDGTSLSVDTNPFNLDKYTDRDALKAIPEINKALGLPDSVYDRMGSTTAMQGVQSVDFGNLHVSWSYHPDNGMEVIYELAVESDQELTADDLKEAYEKQCESSWATLSGDGTSLSVDTNPFNLDKYTDRDALKAIPEINKALGLPDSIYDRMGSTTAMQGVQSVDFGNLHVSWSYHPDNGMEVIYELAVKSDQELTTDDLKEVYEKNCESSWATLSGDGTSLSVDTNPFNLDKYTDRDALKAIPEINKALGLPDSVYGRMGSTTAMQGVQTFDYGNLHVSWSYHPDNGMEVVYAIH